MSVFDDLIKKREELKLKEKQAIDKALSSNNLVDIEKATRYVEHNKNTEEKSLLVDISSFGFSGTEVPKRISYEVLRGMSELPLIRSIIETRRDQISNYSAFSVDGERAGWTIQKKVSLFKERPKQTSQDTIIIENIANFLMRCGTSKYVRMSDNFNQFLRKSISDSLIFDQMVFESVYNRAGELVEFIAVDGTTYRLLRPQDADKLPTKRKMKPFCVQYYDGRMLSYFYPWELCFGVRNPSTDLKRRGYGMAELESLVKVITWLISADEYNGNYFSKGSSPKGILQIKGKMSKETVDSFRCSMATASSRCK